MRVRTAALASGAVLITAGTSSYPRRRQASSLRSPAMRKYRFPPSGSLRTVMGQRSPFWAMLFARISSSARLKSRRGWWGLGRMLPTGSETT